MTVGRGKIKLLPWKMTKFHPYFFSVKCLYPILLLAEERAAVKPVSYTNSTPTTVTVPPVHTLPLPASAKNNGSCLTTL